ncbi:MAG TPA: hypothetical protein VGJ36_08775 [Gemmatimonadales bacterium]|jgi:hypothetical protein
MQHRAVSALVAPVLLAVAGFSHPLELQAQAAAAPQPESTATQLASLSRERAARWAGAAPVVHCAPAPLTERPGVAGELARPHVAPLEAAFFDARIVKRTLAARAPRSDR